MLNNIKLKVLKSLLFKPDLIKAILDGRKTQTRRIVKPQPDERGLRMTNVMFEDYHGKEYKPKFMSGDTVYVKEAWHPKRHNMPTGWPYEYKATALEDGNPTDEPWKSPLFMPERAARIFLEITDVRAERLQDISEEDAIAEGVDMYSNRASMMIDQEDAPYENNLIKNSTPITLFSELWDSINRKTYPWDSNPWVWVFKFKRIER